MKDLNECLGKSKPFMNLGDSNQAPSLNYNLPQKSTFTAYGTQPIYLDEEIFNNRAILEPKDMLISIQSKEVEDLVFSVQKDIENDTNSSGLILDLEKMSTNSFLTTGKQTQNTKADDMKAEKLPVEVNQIQKYSVSEELKTTISKSLGYDLSYIIGELKKNKAAIVTESFGKFKQKLSFISRPKAGKCLPMLFVIEEYKTASYLGDYGAGRTLSTFSLLPGEKTTISVKSFHERSETQKRSENILDSFSKNSADSFEKTLSEEANLAEASSASATHSNQRDVTNNISTSVSASATIGMMAKVSANFSYNRSGFNSSKDATNIASSRDSHVKNIAEAMEKHSNETNANREIEINTSSDVTETSSTENSTVRELENPNLNRVLNFVFRQLQQEYVSVTYLNNIKIAFTNGHPESTVIVPINELDKLLNSVIKPQYISLVREKILHDYHTIENYKNKQVNFLNRVKYTPYNSGSIPILSSSDKSSDAPDIAIEPSYYYKKISDIEDIYTSAGGNGLKISVPGVILNVNRNTLRTSSVIVDALLGQGDALDCFNKIQQEAAIEKLQFENQKLNLEAQKIEQEQEKMKQEAEVMAMEKDKLQVILEAISQLSPAEQIKAYKEIFNPCCPEVSQISINNEK